jgi:hypothetical protein
MVSVDSSRWLSARLIDGLGVEVLRSRLMFPYAIKKAPTLLHPKSKGRPHQ